MSYANPLHGLDANGDPVPRNHLDGEPDLGYTQDDLRTPRDDAGEHYYGDGCPEHPALAEGRVVTPADPIVIPRRHRPASPLARFTREVWEELHAAEEAFPDQHLPDGTADDDLSRRTRDMFRRVTKEKAARGTVTWWDVLREEFFEAGAEVDPERLRAELRQVAAMAFRWAIDLELGPDRVINVPPDPVHEPDSRVVKELARRQEQTRAAVKAAGAEPWSAQDDLAKHLASQHALCNAFELDGSELYEAHEHEHDGPGTIRDHPRDDRTWHQEKIDAVLAERED